MLPCRAVPYPFADVSRPGPGRRAGFKVLPTCIGLSHVLSIPRIDQVSDFDMGSGGYEQQNKPWLVVIIRDIDKHLKQHGVI